MSTNRSTSLQDRDHRESSATEPAEVETFKPTRPSLLQVTAGVLTAVSATALLSFLGVWGTVLGMGMMSVLTVLGNYMYSTWIQRTTDKVKAVHPPKPRARTHHAATATPAQADDRTQVIDRAQAEDAPSDADRTQVIDAARADDATEVFDEQATAELPAAARSGPDPTGQDPNEPDDDEPAVGRLRATWRAMVDRYGRRRIVAAIVAVFVVLGATVTVIELSAGRPMADIVRNNDEGTGTSLFGGRTSEGIDDVDQAPQDIDPQDGPPADQPQQDDPPADEAPADEPPAEEPEQHDDQPADEPPADEPPADEAPADEPPADGERGTDERGTQPPADEPPADDQAGTDDGGTTRAEPGANP